MKRAVFPALQQPDWPDRDALAAAVADLADLPPLVPAKECDQLKARLAAVARGEAFLLQGGHCAETFADVTAEGVHATLRTLLQMAVVLVHATGLPVVKVGRLAGQYGKPRSLPTETRNGLTLPAYRGDAVNGLAFTAEAREPDPARLLRAYHAAATTLNLVRAFTAAGHAEVPACGVSTAASRAAEFYTSHEALLLDYESALTRKDSRTGEHYGLSGHMLWIGERTRRLDGAHLEFAAGIGNPIGVKLGPSVDCDEALTLIDRLDPDREPGRLTFVIRMGADRVRDRLPALVEKVTASGARVVWVCDPMHGNTYQAASGHKTRDFDTVLDEVRGFFEVHHALGTHPGGVHLELTGGHVTECVGAGVRAEDLGRRYETACDPRLNHTQSLELAFRVAGMVRHRDQVFRGDHIISRNSIGMPSVPSGSLNS
ncbi:3-deoxy-7-phosphoheptulonate synthase class II [Acrocarpospora catenulata]|uniref:3-deoxy-7-phosphoheptulonate synthase class II n=1 Tax=Acrocarpospora catenulata TaxID=2836182 RepID=UPI001BD961A3|nr:3-deoxy-7-phosphoheptulonate synthase class II [Acrocarpospora catenulata]